MKSVKILFIIFLFSIIGCEKLQKKEHPSDIGLQSVEIYVDNDQLAREKIISVQNKEEMNSSSSLGGNANKDKNLFPPFYIYSDKGFRGNHYTPSGFMGDWKCIKLNDSWTENCFNGETCLKIDYDLACSRGTIAKSKIFGVGSNGTVILDDLIKKEIVENTSATEVRLNPDLDTKESVVREIANGDFNRIWDILQQSPKEGEKWGGIYWLNPPNNWGSRKGGYNLTGAEKLVFWAKGENGGEQIQEFTVGGIGYNYPDSDLVVIGPIILSSVWREYTIDLRGKDLSYVSGGFAWTTSENVNGESCKFYLDDIRFE